MFRVGAVNIDTSHPVAFADIMRESQRATYTCVYNSGFRSDEYVDKFMKEKQVPVRCQSLEEMVDLIDIAFIHSCNWDKHLELAEPFIKAGKPVFIDKPVVGNLAQCHRLEEYVRSGAVILGGSAFRHCYEFKDFMAKSTEERGDILSLYGVIGVDEFNYGIHIIEAIGSFVSGKANSVKCITNGQIELYHVNFENGMHAVYELCPGVWRPAVMLVTTTTETYHIQPETQNLYKPLLDNVFDVLEKRTPVTIIEELTESIKIAIAAKVSRENDGIDVKLDSLRSDDFGYDGNAFEVLYASSYPGT